MIKGDYITLTELQIKGRQAKQASYVLANIGSKCKQDALFKMADYLLKYKQDILKANQIDLNNALENRRCQILKPMFIKLKDILYIIFYRRFR